jgi:acyl carrier protein phosphodiesterase
MIEFELRFNPKQIREDYDVFKKSLTELETLLVNFRSEQEKIDGIIATLKFQQYEQKVMDTLMDRKNELSEFENGFFNQTLMSLREVRDKINQDWQKFVNENELGEYEEEQYQEVIKNMNNRIDNVLKSVE